MSPTDKPVSGPQNEPMRPVAWIKTFTGKSGKPARVFTTTMGASQDLLSEGTRRMLVNACYWAVGMEGKIPDKSDVTIVGDYTPLPFGFGAHKKGVKPSDLAGRVKTLNRADPTLMVRPVSPGSQQHSMVRAR